MNMNADKSAKPQRIAKGAQPSFFQHPETEAMYGMLIILLEEICVIRDRLDTYERLGANGIAVSEDAVEAYQPSEAVEAARETRRRNCIDRVMRPVRTLQEAAVRRAQQKYETTAEQIAEREI